jgi:GMP synthase (glutamine-hydrolysing)
VRVRDGRVLVVRNTPAGGPGRLRDVLERCGAAVEVVAADAGQEPPGRLRHDALVVLGGGFLPDDDARAPWLPRVRELTRQALADRTPVLGVCLGGQLLAAVAGGEVRGAYGEPECGSTQLTIRQEAADDPLLHGLPERVTAIEHHVDRITALPPGAAWLVSGAACPYQGFRVGPAAWGVQFHPEITAGRLLGWDPVRLAAQGFDRAALHEAAVRDEPASAAVWERVAERFAALVTG